MNAAPITITPGHEATVQPLHSAKKDYSEANRRLMLVRAFRAMIATKDGGPDSSLSPRAAARELGVGRASLWRWEKVVNGHDLDDPKQLHAVLEILATPLKKANAKQRGQKSKWEPLLAIEAVKTELRSFHAATLRASGDAMTSDRRTGNCAVTLRLFATSEHCPVELKPLLLESKFPDCFKRFLTQVTPEIEALIRGPKHFQLNGFSGRRDKTIGLPDGRRAYLPAGWVIELDDMSVNQPFWVDGGASGTGDEGKPILSRQGLYARCLIGGWRAVELIARPREAYTSADILRFIRRFCLLYGKPRKLRIERSVWAARNIAGFVFDGEWKQQNGQRPAMSDDDRQNLADGLEAIGIEIEYCHSARGKSDLEGSFDPLQTYLAGFTRDFPNIGRHAGEFEQPAKQLRRVRAESHHPRDLGFPHQNELLVIIQRTFDFINALPRSASRTGNHGKTTFDERWNEDTTKWPLTPLASSDLAAFLPTIREREIIGGAVYPKVNGIEFPFRALEFAELGDGYKTFVRFDETEPSVGAAIYSREGTEAGAARTGANHQQHAHGDFICYARYDVPAPTTYAANVPADLPTYTTEQLYGTGAEADGGALLKRQQKVARLFVRSAFSGRLPGQPAMREVEARNGVSVGRVQINRPATGGDLAAPETARADARPTDESVPASPVLPAKPLPLRRSSEAIEQDFDRQSERLARDEARASRRQQQPVLDED